MSYSVMVDQGHSYGGNHNRGYSSKSKWKNEGDANFYASQYLIKWLKAYGFKVGVTRNKITDRPAVSGTALANDLYNRMLQGRGYTIFYSWHTNAFRKNQATGAEVWVYYNKSKDLANRISRTIANTLGIVNRGVKVGSYAVLRGNQATYSMLAEHCFHDNDSDVAKYEANIDRLAYNIATQMAQYLGIKKQVNFTGGGSSAPAPKPKEELDIMDRGDMFLIAYTDKTDKELLKKVINNYFLQGTGAQFVLSKSGEFDYTGLGNRTVINIGGKNVSKGAFSKIPRVQYFVMNDNDYNVLMSGQANWGKIAQVMR